MAIASVLREPQDERKEKELAESSLAGVGAIVKDGTKE